MASAFGENRGMVCAHCGLRYDDMRTGRSFKELRNEIISIGTDAKTGRTKYGRRHGVLGYAHEIKMNYWDQHLRMCESAIEWRPVVGFDRYEVSNFGRVRSLVGRGGAMRAEPIEMSPSTHPSGHLIIPLVGSDGRKVTRKVHHLVLEAFDGPRPDGAICRHLDGNPKRNVVGNIVWGTPRENYDDAMRLGEVARGARHGMAKLTEELVQEVRDTRRTEKGVDIARRLKVSQALISMIRSGKIWRTA